MFNYLHSLFVQFYCLPIGDILVLMGTATYLFLRLEEKLPPRKIWKSLISFSAVVWVVLITYATISSREGAVHDSLALIPFHSYREVLNGGNPEILRSNFMNAILFYPAGLLTVSALPKKWSGWVRVLVIALGFAALSAGIEFLQYQYGIGRAEMDDVIHNSLGAVLGGLACFLSVGLLP